ncbi:MAG: TerB family tellurite resistance protein [Pseudomonadota bacterium]
MIQRLFDRIDALLNTSPSDDDDNDAIEKAVRLCSACLLVEVVRADHTVDEAELATVLERVRAQFDLTPEEAAELRSLAQDRVETSVSLYEFTRTLHEQMTREQKATLIGAMWDVAYADGHLDMHEDALILKVADLLYVPRSEVMRLKAIAASS